MGVGAVKMRTQVSLFALAVFAAALFAPPAMADGRGRSVGKGLRAASSIARPDRGRSPSIRVPDLRGLGDRGGRGGSAFPVLEALGRASSDRGGRGGSPFPILDAISRAANDGRGGRNESFPILRELERRRRDGGRDDKHYGNSPLDLLYGLQQLGQYGGYSGYGNGYGNGYGAYPYYDSYYRNKAAEEYSDSMRDAAIVNAVGNVVTAIVQTQGMQTQVPGYVQQAPAYVQPAPQAQTYVQPSPMGRYETRREVVGGGYYERDQIWVPESRDPRTGHIIEGHHEYVKRWVPEVIQETRVWVAP